MPSPSGISCPKCHSSDFTRKISEIYSHYKHKEAVKNFFGAEVCEIPDYLKDAAFELLEKKDEYEISAEKEMTIQDDTSTDVELSGMDSPVSDSPERRALPSRDFAPEDISPPPDPALKAMPLIVPFAGFLGGMLFAAFFALKITMIRFKYYRLLLAAAVFLFLISILIFIALSLVNQRMINDYEAALASWKKKYVCARCRKVFSLTGS